MIQLNKRIKFLADKTALLMPGVYKIEYESGKMGVEFTEDALEKFAELIVKECAEVAADHDALDIYEEIREHFGVEE